MNLSSDDLSIGYYDFDDRIIQAVLSDRKPHFRIYAPDIIAVVLGRGSNPEVELFLDACIADKIPILRRHGGGCAVVIDPGNIIISVVLPTEGIKGNQQYFNKLSMWLSERLEAIGIKGVYQAGISDLVLDNKKVGGSSIHRTQDYLYYSATLLAAPRFDLMARYLRYPPRAPEYRKGRSHIDFTGTLPLHAVDNSMEKLLLYLENTSFWPISGR